MHAYSSDPSLYFLCDSSTPKQEAVRSSETWVTIYQSAWRHIPDDTNLHSVSYKHDPTFVIIPKVLFFKFPAF
jgi:hypothetical protein